MKAITGFLRILLQTGKVSIIHRLLVLGIKGMGLLATRCPFPDAELHLERESVEIHFGKERTYERKHQRNRGKWHRIEFVAELNAEGLVVGKVRSGDRFGQRWVLVRALSGLGVL